ncbi:MAG: UDP-N-acetylmuramate dehydrogenase [Bacteroidales bacterium]|nr:UDP-N-acetylmuramate dehydrogenase [Bacteroidales bacterium]
MADIKSNFPLESLNTFGLKAVAKYYIKITSSADVEELTDKNIFQSNSRLILGGGSNLLFKHDFPGLIIHSCIEGLKVIHETETEAVLRVGSGYSWDEFAAYAAEHNFGGIENLSGIPGSVGASPVQNIGAYGVEVADVIDKVEGFDLDEKIWKEYSNEACEFDYRSSFFKTVLKNSFLITYVHFRLQKNPWNFVTAYGNLEEEFGKTDGTLMAMRQLILRIREAKLPDVREFGNAGSFFKNPVIEAKKAKKLKSSYPAMPVYPAGSGKQKLSAAWLIDQAGFKGCKLGNAGSYEKQPLVLINLGNASAQEILELAGQISDSVKLIFGIRLEPEVNIV